MLFLNSCTKDLPAALEPCEITNVSYDTDILPVLETSCNNLNCHSTGSMNGDFTSYADFKIQADSGQLWFLVGVVKAMPPLNKLDSLTINQFKSWIDCGALDN